MNMKPGMTTGGAAWAFRLMAREAGGEQLESISQESWREVLGYPKDQDARQAMEAIKRSQVAA